MEKQPCMSEQKHYIFPPRKGYSLLFTTIQREKKNLEAFCLNWCIIVPSMFRKGQKQDSYQNGDVTDLAEVDGTEL